MRHRTILFGLAAFALLQSAPALAGSSFSASSTSNCIFAGGAVNCVRHYRESEQPFNNRALRPPTAEDIAAARERDRKWVARCQPLLRQDRYGVSRYYYAAPGCEFGRLED